MLQFNKKGVLFKFFVELCWRKSRGRGQCLGEPIGGKANKKEAFVKRRVCFVRWAFEMLNLWVLSYVGSTRRFMNLSVRKKNRMLYACTQKNLPCQETWCVYEWKPRCVWKWCELKWLNHHLTLSLGLILHAVMLTIYWVSPSKCYFEQPVISAKSTPKHGLVADRMSAFFCRKQIN